MTNEQNTRAISEREWGLVEAAKYLRNDMLMRAKANAWQNNDEVIVEAGHGAWAQFNSALAAYGDEK